MVSHRLAVPAAPPADAARRTGAAAVQRRRPGAPTRAFRTADRLRRGLLGICILAGHGLAAALNTPALRAGERPSLPGLVASTAYAVVWLGYALVVGRHRPALPVRRLAALWAAAIAVTAIGGSVLRQNPDAVPVSLFGVLAVALLVAVAAPLYGIAGLFGVDPVVGLVPTAFGLAAAMVVVGVVTRRVGGAAAPRRDADALA